MDVRLPVSDDLAFSAPSIIEPPVRAGRYLLRLAGGPADLERVTRLRFEVFNLELGEGLGASWARCRDEDGYDAWCHHLMVCLEDTGEVIGTYRMQTCAMASAHEGFYSAQAFDLAPLAGLLPAAVELGRACIARGHRNHRVLFLLWRGLARYMTVNGARFFFGSCSLTGTDAARAAAVYRRLAGQGSIAPAYRVTPWPAFACPAAATGPDGLEADASIPPLMQRYLDYGARIVSTPALDQAFGTTDFLALFDAAAATPRTRRLFFE